MQQRITFFTIGVSDLDAVKNFYINNFGWTPMKDENGIVFFKLNGIIFGLYPKHELAEDIGVKDDGKGFKNFSMAINMESEAAVDKLFADFKTKGVNIIKAPEKVFWGGYSGYFSDPDGFLIEVAHNPFFEMDEKGLLRI